MMGFWGDVRTTMSSSSTMAMGDEMSSSSSSDAGEPTIGPNVPWRGAAPVAGAGWRTCSRPTCASTNASCRRRAGDGRFVPHPLRDILLLSRHCHRRELRQHRLSGCDIVPRLRPGHRRHDRLGYRMKGTSHPIPIYLIFSHLSTTCGF